MPRKIQDEEQAVAGVRDNDIRKNGVGVLTAVTHNPHHAETGFLLSAEDKVDDGAAVVIMDMAVTGTPTDGTGLQFRPKQSHVGNKQRI